MGYRIVKWVMAAAAVLFLLAALLIPGMERIRGDVFAWIFYGVYVLITAMVWAIGGKATRNVGQGIDKDEVNKETKVTQEIQRNLSFWSLWSAFRLSLIHI